MSGWRSTRFAGVIILVQMTSANILLMKFAVQEQIHCEQKFANKVCTRTIKVPHGESEFLQDLPTQKMLTKIKFAYIKNLLCKVCSQNLIPAKKNCSQ
jgi:hypothetical protein